MTPVALQIAQKASFDFVRYASVWEDADILCQALAPRAKGGRLLSIASSGDNALALLTLNPKEVVAADLNPAQLACLELRIAAFRRLKDSQLLGFLGVLPDASRLRRYNEMRRDLSPVGAAWWDAHAMDIENGLIHAGKFERYLRFFGMTLLPLLQPGPWRKALLLSGDTSVQASIYQRQWNHLAWRGFFRVFFSRPLMGAFGRDQAFFKEVKGLVGRRILERTRHALCAIPAASNPYLQYITSGNFPLQALPLYLRPEARALIRSRLKRVTLFVGPVQDAPGRFDGFNLSDIFEYMNPQEHEAVYTALAKRAKPKARLAYWNLLIERLAPASVRKARQLKEISANLQAHDKAWFYQSFVVDEIR